jgi:hypothetical protein
MYSSSIYVYSVPVGQFVILGGHSKRWAGHETRMGRKGILIGYWWGNPEGKSPLRRPRRSLVGKAVHAYSATGTGGSLHAGF